eukprot:4100116-Lingulodinium_polyedra.AAC.1
MESGRRSRGSAPRLELLTGRHPSTGRRDGRRHRTAGTRQGRSATPEALAREVAWRALRAPDRAGGGPQTGLAHR